MDNELQVKTTPFYKLKFVLIALLSAPFHELGHVIGYYFDGIPTIFHFNAVDTVDGSIGFWGPMGGPAIVIIAAIMATALLYLGSRKSELWIFFINIMVLTRLAPIALITIFNPSGLKYNDEGIIASVLNLPMWQVYGFVLSILFLILLALYLKAGAELKRHFSTCHLGYVLFFVFLIVFGVRVT